MIQRKKSEKKVERKKMFDAKDVKFRHTSCPEILLEKCVLQKNTKDFRFFFFLQNKANLISILHTHFSFNSFSNIVDVVERDADSCMPLGQRGLRYRRWVGHKFQAFFMGLGGVRCLGAKGGSLLSICQTSTLGDGELSSDEAQCQRPQYGEENSQGVT